MVQNHCGSSEYTVFPWQVLLAVLARSGLLPPGDGVPRERVREMLISAADDAWSSAANMFNGGFVLSSKQSAEKVLEAYDRTKEPTK